MFGGDNYGVAPFNLATQGQRQPGSSFKPFVLAEALKQGISPSRPGIQEAHLHPQGRGALHGQQLRGRLLRGHDAGQRHDLLRQRGLRAAGHEGQDQEGRPARAQDGRADAGLEQLRDGARRPAPGRHAARHGARLRDLRDRRQAGLRHPLARRRARSRCPCRARSGSSASTRSARTSGARSSSTTARRWSTSARPSASSTRASPARSRALLQNVVKQGTATRAQIPGVMVAGKTGTTENYGDAWFVGWTKEYTVAVWVGYPDEFKPMKTEFQGDPVAGGTYPAGIWKTFMQSLLEDRPAAQEGRRGRDGQGHRPGVDADAGRRRRSPPPTATVPPATPETPPATAGPGDGAADAPRSRRPTRAGDQPPPTEEQPPATEEQPPATDPGTGGGEAAPRLTTGRARRPASAPAARAARRRASRPRRSATAARRPS